MQTFFFRRSLPTVCPTVGGGSVFSSLSSSFSTSCESRTKDFPAPERGVSHNARHLQEKQDTFCAKVERFRAKAGSFSPKDLHFFAALLRATLICARHRAKTSTSGRCRRPIDWPRMAQAKRKKHVERQLPWESFAVFCLDNEKVVLLQ